MALQNQESGRGLGAFPQPRRISLAESIADSIAEAIATRQLLPGERIVEMNLAKRLGVSRVPIREALKVLHAHGILSGANHRGYRVADFGPQTAAKVFETRLMIETFLLRDAIATWRAGKADPGRLDAPIRVMEVAAKAKDGLASLMADLEFHRTIRTAAHNEIAATLWDALARHVLIIFNQDSYRDKDLNAVVRQHKAFRDFILDCVKAAEPRSEAELRQAIEDHLLQIARRTNAVPHARPFAAKARAKQAEEV
jgi:DNA-binding GntR family transcriptional regulator